MPDAPYLSLYRRYRPQRFSEVRGQEHVTAALRNAVRNDRVGHAYLFSGPRGTGKTSTARILAKALNCTELQDGEPCGRCESCSAVQAGASLDVLELDAASNNGVEAMRDLVSRAALGSPGRWKVYIIDEVHMLSTAASNALLKTLEEPPGHVVFVLATTDPQKVLPTIRSRTQPYEFHLLPAEVLESLVADVNAAADLGLDRDALGRVVRRGAGSARDALSALDQAAAAGGLEEEPDATAGVIAGLASHDAGAVLTAVAAACAAGRDPRRLATELVQRLRQGFLATMAPELADVAPDERAAVQGEAASLGTAAVVRAIEVLGDSLVVMRDALDTRVTLEVALLRLCAPQADTSAASLAERLERLERRVADGPVRDGPAPAAAPASASAAPVPVAEAAAPSGTRATLGAVRRRGGEASPPAPPPDPVAAPGGPPVLPSPAPGATVPFAPAAGPGMPDRDELTKAWGDGILTALPQGVRSVYRNGRWLAVDEGVARFALPNGFYVERAEPKRREVEAALAAHFGVRLKVEIVEDPAEGSPAPSPASPGSSAKARGAAPGPDPDEDALTAGEVVELEVAPAVPSSNEDRLREAFPGVEEIE